MYILYKSFLVSHTAHSREYRLLGIMSTKVVNGQSTSKKTTYRYKRNYFLIFPQGGD